MHELLNPPELDAPLASWTPTIAAEGIDGRSYNVVKYADKYWAVPWGEQFDVPRFASGQAHAPVILAETLEEIRFGLGAVGGAGALKADTLSEMAPNFLSVRPNARDSVLKVFPDSPGLKNAALTKTNLFEMGDGLPVCILSPAPSRACNYRCEYCYHHEHGFTKNPAAMASWEKTVLTAVERIPRPLFLSMGAMGEPLFNAHWRKVAGKVLTFPHVRRLTFVSNLFKDPTDIVDQFDPKRVGMVASLHPTEFKNGDADFATFLDRVVMLIERGASIVVNYVLTPEQLRDFPRYRQMLAGRGVPMTSNVLRGPYRGKMYPEAYTAEERELVRQCHSDIPFIYDSQSHQMNPYGKRCTAGRYAFQLEFDGTLYDCQFARQRLGSIFDETLPVRNANSFCTARKCESQTTIGFQEDVLARYRMQGSLHHFTEREPGEAGLHPLL